MVELAERVGPSVLYWQDQPFAYVLWTYRHLQELDRRRQWLGRMQRIESAMLMAAGFHDPKMLDREREKAIAAAGRAVDHESLLTQGEAMALALPALLAEDTNGAG